MALRLGFIAWLAVLLGAPLALAQTTSTQPAPATSASQSVVVNGKSAARLGDATGEGQPTVQGSPDVLINGKPAALSGGGCAGSSNVFVNGKPLARAGDNCAH